jgi:hypothetical protein
MAAASAILLYTLSAVTTAEQGQSKYNTLFLED